MATSGIVQRLPGGEQYENVLEVVHPDGGKALPDGQLLHLAGSMRDGWLMTGGARVARVLGAFPRRH